MWAIVSSPKICKFYQIVKEHIIYKKHFRREISLQFHRYFLLNQHRDRNQLMVLARQVC